MKRIVPYLIFCSTISSLYADISTNDIHKYFIANLLQFNGKNNPKVYELYKSMLGSQAPVYAYKGYVHFLFDTANYPHILQLISQLDPVFEDDSAIQLIFAQVLEKTGNIDAADERYVKLNDRFKNNQEIAFNAANSYMRRKEPENALLVIDSLLNSSPRKANNFIFHFMKAQIYIQLNKKKEALAAVQKSLEMHPRFDKGWLLLALLHEQENQLNEAIKGYTNFLEITGESNKEVEQHVLGLIFKQKIKGNNTKPVQINKVCIDNALRLFEKKQYQKALDDLDECIKKDSKNNEAKLLKIEILSAINLKNKAAEQLKIWIDQEPKNSLWYKILHLLTQTNFPVQEVIAILLFIEKRHPETILPSLYLADLYTRTKNYKAALKKHHKALAATKNMPLREKIIFQIAFIHYEAKQFKQFKKVIAQARNHTIKYAPLLNLIAYYYTTQEIRLEIASPLIAHALEQDAHNPHFLDTQATIYLKQGNSAQALLILEKIAQIVPSDYTVMMHLAQAMHGEGKIDQAIKILEAAHCHARKSQDALESKLLLGQWKSKKQSRIIASAL